MEWLPKLMYQSFVTTSPPPMGNSEDNNFSFRTAISKLKLLSQLAMVNIYIFIAIALDETSILDAVHFSMQNIY